MKLKLSLLDKIFNKDKFKEIINLREQVDYMVGKYEEIDIITKMNYVIDGEDLTKIMFNYEMLSFNEYGMYRDMGEDAVIKRLRDDRDKIYKALSQVKEVDVSYISKTIRDNKLNKILC